MNSNNTTNEYQQRSEYNNKLNIKFLAKQSDRRAYKSISDYLEPIFYKSISIYGDVYGDRGLQGANAGAKMQ